MRIVFFAESYLPSPNGVATTVAACVAALQKLGHTVYVVTPKQPGSTPDKNVIRLYSVRLYEALDMRTALLLPEPKLIKIIRMKKIDIIHGQDGGTMSFLGWQIARLKNTPYVITYHTIAHEYTHYLLRGKLFRPPIVKAVTKIFGNMCEEIITPTQRAKAELRKVGVKAPIRVLPNGLNRSLFQNQKKGYIRDKLTISPTTRVLLFVGRLGREKSVEFLIKSFQYISENDPNTVLVLVGGGPDKNTLLKLARTLGVEQKIFFMGFVSPKDMPRVYADADVFVIASKTETQGMAPIEALTSGLPVVAVSDRALSEFIIDGYNGYLTPRNERAFAEKVVELTKSAEQMKTMGKHAKLSTKKYSLEDATMELVKIYDEIIEKHKGRNAKSPFRKTLRGARRIIKLLSE